MIKLRDLDIEDLLMDKKEVGSFFEKRDFYLEDKRPVKKILMDYERMYRDRLKAENSPYFRTFKALMSYGRFKVSTRRKIQVYPYFNRGAKGIMCEDGAEAVLPLEVRKRFLENKEKFDTRIVLFDGVFLGIPLTNLRLMKK